RHAGELRVPPAGTQTNPDGGISPMVELLLFDSLFCPGPSEPSYPRLGATARWLLSFGPQICSGEDWSASESFGQRDRRQAGTRRGGRSRDNRTLLRTRSEEHTSELQSR